MAVLGLDIASRRHTYADADRSGEVENGTAALQAFFAHERKRGCTRVVMEATGVYYLDAALIAHEAGLEVSVLNPKVAARFAQSLGHRNKTDRSDARALFEYGLRMPCELFVPPSKVVLELRSIARYLAHQGDTLVAAKNRLHALESDPTTPGFVKREERQTIAQIERRIEKGRAEAKERIKSDQAEADRFAALCSITGVGEISALALLAELATVPKGVSAKSCASHAGLDVRLHESGSSVHKPGRLSKQGNRYLRRALYMPALVAVRHDAHAKRFYERLVSRGKKKMQALCAVMRKMLTAAWALYRNPGTYDGARLYAGG